MFIVNNYTTAVLFCFITMLCWGSWGNTQKLAGRKLRYEFFYWDYVIGIFLFSLLSAFTLGSWGEGGRSFIPDLMQAKPIYLGSAFLGGIIFNASNILLSTAISLAGMSVAFPVGVGLALVLGVVINYAGNQKGDPYLLFIGVILVTIAIILNALAYRLKNKQNGESKGSSKGLWVALAAGLLMAFFYRFVAAAIDLDQLAAPAIGKMTPYTAVVIFSTGILVSNLLFNTILMKHPVEGSPLTYKTYFTLSFSFHMIGILGGIIWALGNSLNFIAAGKAGAAISYGLGQGATMVSACWGVFIWKEFKGSGKKVSFLLAGMFLLFLTGLSFLIMAGQ